MAESVGLKGGDDFEAAGDVIASVVHQRVKIEFGGDGTATDVATDMPLPVGEASKLATVAIGTYPVPTSYGLPTVAVGTMAGLPSTLATVAVGTVGALPTAYVVPPSTYAIGALPTAYVVPPATISVATLAGLPSTLATVAVGTMPLPVGAATEDTVSKRFGGGKTQGAQAINTSGNNTILTPASGKKIRLYWLGLSTSQDNAAEVLALAKFTTGGTPFYRWNLGAPGAFSHWEVVTGGTDEALVINLSGAQTVQANYTYSEVT